MFKFNWGRCMICIYQLSIKYYLYRFRCFLNFRIPLFPYFPQLVCTNTTFIPIGTVSAKIAPLLKCYKNASRLNRYNFLTDNAIDFLFSTLRTKPFHYEVMKIGSR